MSKAKVLLIGMGGVGSIASYTLKRNGLAEVTVVARSSYDILTTKGFRLESCDYGVVEGYKPDHVAKNVEEAVQKQGPFKFIVVTTKNIPDISPVEEIIAPAVSAESVIVLQENGCGIERDLFKAFPKNHIVSGVTIIGSTLYGDVVKQGCTDGVSYGAFINPALPVEAQKESAKAFHKLYRNDINNAKYDEDVKFIRWRKLVYNAAINSSCAITNVDSGRLQLFGGYKTLVLPAMKEVIAIAKSDGVELPSDIIDTMMNADEDYYPPSMLIDVRKGQYTEYRIILGNALDVAKENGVDAPVLTVLHNLLHIIQMRTMEEKGRFELPAERPMPADNYELKYKY